MDITPLGCSHDKFEVVVMINVATVVYNHA